MPQARTVRLVARKETLDLLRDRRTIITALVVPLVSFPVLFGVLGYFSSPTSNPSPVLLANMDTGTLAMDLQEALLQAPGLSITFAHGQNLSQVVQQGHYDAAILIPANFSSSIMAGSQADISVYSNPSNSRAQIGVSVVENVVNGMSQEIAALRLQQKGVTQSDLNPILIAQTSVGRVTNPNLLFAASLFPSFLLYFTFLGGFYFMVDDIAGEKERRSLEALFTLPSPRSDIFLGKYLVAVVLSLITAGLGLVGTLFSLNELPGVQNGISIPLVVFPSIIGIVALAALSLSALGFCVSTFAKNIREAQQYLSPIFIIFFLPLYFVSFLPPSQTAVYATLPLMGYTILMRDVIMGTASAGEIVSSIGVNVLFLLLLLWLGLRLLNSEKVVLRTG